MKYYAILANATSIFPEMTGATPPPSAPKTYQSRRYATDPAYRERIKKTAREWKSRKKETA